MFLNLLALLHMAWFLGPLPSQQPSFNTILHCQGLLKIKKGEKFNLGLPPSVEPLAPWTCVLLWVLLLCPSVSSCKPLHFLECMLFTNGPNLAFFPGCLLVGGVPLSSCHTFPLCALPNEIPFSCVFSSSSVAFRCQILHLFYK